MKNIQEVVLRIHTEIMHQKGINQKSTPDMEIRPKNGITSESIVIFILDLEEELGIEFDDYSSKNYVYIMENTYEKIIFRERNKRILH